MPPLPSWCRGIPSGPPAPRARAMGSRWTPPRGARFSRPERSWASRARTPRRSSPDGATLLQFAASRVLWLIPTLLAMAVITFLVMHATPGSPLDPVAEGANPLSPEAQKNLAAHYGLDRP